MSAAYLSFGGFIPGPLTFEYSALYSFASQSRSVAANMERPPIRKEMAGMVRLLLRDAGGNMDDVRLFPETPAPWGYKPLPKTNRALVGFSGGKDSVAAALKLKERGMDVTLVYVSGINQTTPDTTAGNVSDANSDLAAKVKNWQTGNKENLVEMTCQHCGETFMLDKEEMKRRS